MRFKTPRSAPHREDEGEFEIEPAALIALETGVAENETLLHFVHMSRPVLVQGSVDEVLERIRAEAGDERPA